MNKTKEYLPNFIKIAIICGVLYLGYLVIKNLTNNEWQAIESGLALIGGAWLLGEIFKILSKRKDENNLPE